MADPTIYVYGDLEMARQVIQGMNAILNASPWRSATPDPSNDYQAGGFFVFALMLTLWGAVLGWFVHQKFNLAPLFLAFLIFVVMTVPRTTLIIEDVFSGAAVPVGDTPVGVAVIASLGSTIAYKMAERYNTQFTPFMAPRSVMFEGGFMSPLRMMLALRKMVPTTSDTFFLGNLSRYMAECGQQSSGPGLPNYATADGKVYYLLSNPRVSGITVYKTAINPEGIGINCVDAANYLTIELNEYLDGIDPARMAEKELNAALVTPVGLAYSGPNPIWDWGDTLLAVQNSTGMDVAQSRKFMADLLFHKWSASSMECGIAANNYAFRECLSGMLEASESAKIDIAIGTSIFQKIMIPLMNILTYLFYGLAPIVAVVAVATGIHGVGIILKYAFFGFWVQSWMPVAVFINYIMMEQLKNDLSNFKIAWERGALNIAHFYDVVSTKLMVASDILAATPMITLAILGGGIYALTGVASSMGRAAAAKADASSTAPKIRKVEPLHTFGGSRSPNAFRNMNGNKGLSRFASAHGMGDPESWLRSRLGSLNSQHTSSKAWQAAKQRVNRTHAAMMGTYSKIGSSVLSYLDRFSSSTTGSSGASAKGGGGWNIASNVLKQIGYSDTTSEGLKNTVLGTLSAYASAAKTIGDDPTLSPEERQKNLKNLQNRLIKALIQAGGTAGARLEGKGVGEFAHDFIQGASKGEQLSLNAGRSGHYTAEQFGQLLQQAMTGEESQLQNMATQAEEFRQQYEQAVQRERSLGETYSRLNSMITQQGGNIADVIFSRLQSGIPMPLGYSKDDFDRRIDDYVQNGWLSPQQGLQEKADYAERANAAYDALVKHGYREQLTTDQLHRLSDFMAHMDTHIKSLRAENAFSQVKTNMIGDFMGLGDVGDLPAKVGNQMIEGQNIPDPETLTPDAKRVFNSEGKGEGSLNGHARSLYTHHRGDALPPDELYRQGQEGARTAAKAGKGKTMEYFNNGNHAARREAEERMNRVQQLVSGSWLTQIAQLIGRAADDPVELVANWAKGPGDRAPGDIGRVPVYSNDLVGRNSTPIMRQAYRNARNGAVILADTHGRSLSRRELAEKMNALVPRRGDYGSENEYHDAVVGWALARAAVLERGLEPGLSDKVMNTPIIVETSLGKTTVRHPPAFINPLSLPDSRK